MKIIANRDSQNIQFILDDGRDITKELNVCQFKIVGRVDELIKAELVVYPSEFVIEINDDELKFYKPWNEETSK